MTLQNLEYGFPAGTRVVTKHGLVPIQNIKIGGFALITIGFWARGAVSSARRSDCIYRT